MITINSTKLQPFYLPLNQCFKLKTKNIKLSTKILKNYWSTSFKNTIDKKLTFVWDQCNQESKRYQTYTSSNAISLKKISIETKIYIYITYIRLIVNSSRGTNRLVTSHILSAIIFNNKIILDYGQFYMGSINLYDTMRMNTSTTQITRPPNG